MATICLRGLPGASYLRVARAVIVLACSLSTLSPRLSLAQNFPVETFTLENGLKVLMQPDRSVPSICLGIVFHAGSKNERPGMTGISHLFEHMMFNGSANYAPKQFDRIIEAGGGYSNAFTTWDVTLYYEMFNPDLLAKALDLEADRMRSLKIDTENLEQERGIVKEERRVRVEDSPRDRLDEELRAAAFDAHPYGWPIIGWMKDIDNIALADCQNYFRIYYAPNNAVLCLTGDFDPKSARPLIAAAFRGIPAQPAPLKVIDAEEPQLGERRIEVSVPAEQPAVVAGYHMVSRGHPDFLAYDLLSNVLGAGESSRLHKGLVYESEVASEAAAYVDATEHAGLLIISADVSPGRRSAEVMAGIDSVLADLVAGGVTAGEVEKARNQAQTALVRRLDNNESRTISLLEFEKLDGDYKRLFTIIDDYDRVKAEDVTRVARQCLIAPNRTVAVLVPKEAS